MEHTNRWAHLPSNVLTENQPAIGIRLPNGMIECSRCTRAVPDNSDSDRGLGPSCPHCWVGLDIAGRGTDNAVFDATDPQAIIFLSSNRAVDYRAREPRYRLS